MVSYDSIDYYYKADVSSTKPAMEDEIKIFLSDFAEFLVEKNRRYGDSVRRPLKIFSKHISEANSQARNGILSRLDDKLKRIQNADELRKNDVADLLGYLVFLCMDMNINFEEMID